MDIAKLVQRSREGQGLPPTVRDPGTLARVAELIALAVPRRNDTGLKTDADTPRRNGGSP